MSDMTVRAFENEDFEIDLELKEGIVFIHMEVDNFNKEVLKKMREVCKEIEKEVWIWGWDEIFSYTHNFKFCRLIVPCEVIGKTDNGYEVARWELKPQL